MKEVENMGYNLEKTLDNLKKEGIQEGIQEGIKEGIKEGKYIVAKRLIMKGQDIDTVVDVTELSREEIEKLIDEMNI
jgi:predicted transposase/invertase (TIGR01784 family)